MDNFLVIFCYADWRLEVVFDILGSLSDVIIFIGESFMDIVEFIYKIFELIPILISFVPQPFRNIALSFVSLLLIMYLWKIYKGGS